MLLPLLLLACTSRPVILGLGETGETGNGDSGHRDSGHTDSGHTDSGHRDTFETGPWPPDTGVERVPGTDEPQPQDRDDDPDLYAEGSLWELEITLDRDAYRELQRDGHEYVDATLTWDDRDWLVSIHIKGSSSWQSIDQKPSLVVDVNRRVEDQEFLGAKKLYLHNDCYDPSQMSETLSYRFYREWGYPASRTSFAHLTLNDEDYGFYTVTEPQNDDFLETWFEDPDGNLYENAEAYCDITDVRCMEVEENDEGNDDALSAFGSAARTSGAGWLAAVQPYLDWDRFVAYLALEASIVHWDSYSYDLSNYSLYHEPSLDRWTFLTQSMDLDYGYRPWSYPDCGKYGMDIDRYNMGMLAASCQDDTTCRQAFVEAMSGYADLLEAADGAARVRELDAFIGDRVKADPRRYYSDGEYDEHVACLQSFFEARPGQIREWVAAQ